MTRVCTVCAHPERHAIDRLLVGGTASFRDIAGRYGLTRSSVFRHRTACLPATLVQAHAAEEVRQALDVVQQLKFVNAAALGVLRDAKTSGEGDLVLRAIDRVQKQIELQAKLLGDLAQEGTTTVNIVASPEWLALRGQILAALQPYPEARVAVAGALQC